LTLAGIIAAGAAAYLIWHILNPLEVSVEELGAVYLLDMAEADRAYTGKRILITGDIESVGKSYVNGPITVRLSDVRKKGSIITLADLSDGLEAEAAVLFKGKRVTLLCKCDGMRVGALRLSRCSAPRGVTLDKWTDTPPLPVTRSGHIDLAAETLIAEYWSNEIKADLQFLGKKLRVTGRLDSVEYDYNRDTVAKLGALSNSTFYDIDVYFLRPFEYYAVHLPTGREMTVLCLGGGQNYSGPVLRDCVLEL
jgi:hypothetical protein